MKHLTQDEIKALLREIPDERQRLMLRVAFLHGLRVSEVVSLKREDIRDGYLKVQRLKGSLKTVQPYVKHPDPELDESAGLESLFGTLKNGERLFPMTRNGVYKLMQRAGTRAGIPAHKLHPHALKHSCAMVSIDKIGIQRVRTYLGHKSISSTGAYLVETDETASRAFAGAL
jgi:type 1 fimbriae regulatory protein FimB